MAVRKIKEVMFFIDSKKQCLSITASEDRSLVSLAIFDRVNSSVHLWTKDNSEKPRLDGIRRVGTRETCSFPLPKINEGEWESRDFLICSVTQPTKGRKILSYDARELGISKDTPDGTKLSIGHDKSVAERRLESRVLIASLMGALAERNVSQIRLSLEEREFGVATLNAESTRAKTELNKAGVGRVISKMLAIATIVICFSSLIFNSWLLTEKGELTTELRLAESQVTTLKVEKKAIAIPRDERIEGLQALVTSQKEDIGERRTGGNKLSNELGRARASEKKLIAEGKQLVTQRDTAKAQASAAQNSLREKKGELARVQEQLRTVQATADNIPGLAKDLATANARVSELEKQVTTLQDQLTGSQAEIQTLTSKLATANARVRELTGDLNQSRAIAKLVPNLQKQVRDLHALVAGSRTLRHDKKGRLACPKNATPASTTHWQIGNVAVKITDTMGGVPAGLVVINFYNDRIYLGSYIFHVDLPAKK